MGHTIIMGRKTFDSIGRPLPGRTTDVVTRNREFHISAAVADIHRDQAPPSMVTPGKCIIAPSLNAAFDACPADTESFIVGGAEIYAQAMPSVDTMYITEIQQNIDGDAHFPKVNPTEWQEIDRERHIQHLPQSLEFHFVTYRRHPYRPPIVDIS
jgi:dihydrofolate reductase